jgi:hypothetical protein
MATIALYTLATAHGQTDTRGIYAFNFYGFLQRNSNNNI